MGWIPDQDEMIRANVNAKEEISPAYLATLLNCTKAEAKDVLRRATIHGVVRPLPNGWYKLASPQDGYGA
jgi:hypothetical protein